MKQFRQCVIDCNIQSLHSDIYILYIYIKKISGLMKLNCLSLSVNLQSSFIIASDLIYFYSGTWCIARRVFPW